MQLARLLLSLLVVAGILLCPYTCMGIACAHGKAKQESAAGCHCQKCQHKQDDQSRPADDSNDGHCCVCVCDGALAKATDDDLPTVVLSPSIDTPALDCSALPAMQIVAFAELLSRPTLESGKSMRIVLRSLLI